MKLYVQFMIILIFSFIGEAISNLLNLPVPGSIIGLVLLFLALEFKVIRLRHIDVVGMFLPAAVGIMDRFNDIKDYLLPITIIILVAIFLNVATIGFVVRFIKTRFEGDYVDKGGHHD